MMHYTCDGCMRRLDAEIAQIFVLKIEVYAAADEANTEIDEDAVPWTAIQQQLQDDAEPESERLDLDEVYKECRFEVCSNCRRRFFKNRGTWN